MNANLRLNIFTSEQKDRVSSSERQGREGGLPGDWYHGPRADPAYRNPELRIKAGGCSSSVEPFGDGPWLASPVQCEINVSRRRMPYGFLFAAEIHSNSVVLEREHDFPSRVAAKEFPVRLG